MLNVAKEVKSGKKKGAKGKLKTLGSLKIMSLMPDQETDQDTEAAKC